MSVGNLKEGIRYQSGDNLASLALSSSFIYLYKNNNSFLVALPRKAFSKEKIKTRSCHLHFCIYVSIRSANMKSGIILPMNWHIMITQKVLKLNSANYHLPQKRHTPQDYGHKTYIRRKLTVQDVWTIHGLKSLFICLWVSFFCLVAGETTRKQLEKRIIKTGSSISIDVRYFCTST